LEEKQLHRKVAKSSFLFKYKDNIYKLDYLEYVNIMNHYLIDNEFQTKIHEFRKRLKIEIDDTLETIVEIYNNFYHYLVSYFYFNVRKDRFLISLRSLFEEFIYLNIDNELDYYLVINHLVNNKNLTRSSIQDIFGTGLIQFYKGKDLIMKNKIKKDALYVEIPKYADGAYIKSMAGYIKSQLFEMNNVTFSKQIPPNYYFREYLVKLRTAIRNFCKSLKENKQYDIDIFMLGDLIPKYKNIQQYNRKEKYKCELPGSSEEERVDIMIHILKETYSIDEVPDIYPEKVLMHS